MARVHRALRDSKGDELLDTDVLVRDFLRSRELSRLVAYAEVQMYFLIFEARKLMRQQGKGH